MGAAGVPLIFVAIVSPFLIDKVIVLWHIYDATMVAQSALCLYLSFHGALLNYLIGCHLHRRPFSSKKSGVSSISLQVTSDIAVDELDDKL